jgi:hypothetical protein
MIFAVKILKGGKEAGADAMLLVKVDCTLLNVSSVVFLTIKWPAYLESLVANNIAMG